MIETFYRSDALPDTQWTTLKHSVKHQQSLQNKNIWILNLYCYSNRYLITTDKKYKLPMMLVSWRAQQLCLPSCHSARCANVPRSESHRKQPTADFQTQQCPPRSQCQQTGWRRLVTASSLYSQLNWFAALPTTQLYSTADHQHSTIASEHDRSALLHTTHQHQAERLWTTGDKQTTTWNLPIALVYLLPRHNLKNHFNTWLHNSWTEIK